MQKKHELLRGIVGRNKFFKKNLQKKAEIQKKKLQKKQKSKKKLQKKEKSKKKLQKKQVGCM